MQIRDQVNDVFFKEGENQPTIVIVTKSQSNQSIVITTMPKLLSKISSREKRGLEEYYSTPEDIRR